MGKCFETWLYYICVMLCHALGNTGKTLTIQYVGLDESKTGSNLLGQNHDGQ